MPLAATSSGRIGLTVFACLITLANFLVILAFSLNRRLRTSANRFVISLAASDLLVSCVLMPLNSWKAESVAIPPMTAFVLLASLANICGCTYDRFNAIKNALRYTTIMTKSRFIIVMIVVWAVPLILALIPQIWVHNPDVFGLTPAQVMKHEQNFVAFIAIGILVTCCILAGIYIYIFSVAKQHYDAMRRVEPPNPRIEINGGETLPQNLGRRRQSIRKYSVAIKSTILFAIIGANFLLCWMPLIVINICFAFDRIEILPPVFLEVSEVLMYCNSLLNPITYAFFQRDVRNTLLKLISFPRSIAPSETTRYDTSCNNNSSR